MEASPNQNQNELVPCRICVDFYGSAASDGLCSKCSREQKKQAETDQAQTQEILTLIKQNSQNQQVAAAAAIISSEVAAEQQPEALQALAAAVEAEDSEMTVEPRQLDTIIEQQPAQEVVVDAQAAAQHQPESSIQSESPDSEMNSEHQATPIIEAVNPVVAPAQAAPVVPEQPVEEEAKVDDKLQTNLNKCWECTKKVGILKVACKCSYVFCMKHKHAEAHNCSFDYFKQNQERLTKLNPLIAHDKMQKC